MLRKSSMPKDAAAGQERLLLTLELAEIKEISDILFERLDQKLKAVEAAEAAIEGKMAELERLVQRIEAIRFPGQPVSSRHHEVSTLAKRGMKSSDIADILGMPIGEVELILEICGRPV